jgi:hypothetical protein
MRTLFISPVAAMLALLAPSSMAAYGTQHAFHGNLCQPVSGSGAVYYNDGVSTGKVASGDVSCPLFRTVSLDEEGKEINTVTVTTVGSVFPWNQQVTCTLYLTDATGLTDYTATATATSTASGGKIDFWPLGNHSRFGRLSCHLPPLTGIRSYQIVDSPW